MEHTCENCAWWHPIKMRCENARKKRSPISSGCSYWKKDDNHVLDTDGIRAAIQALSKEQDYKLERNGRLKKCTIELIEERTVTYNGTDIVMPARLFIDAFCVATLYPIANHIKLEIK